MRDFNKITISKCKFQDRRNKREKTRRNQDMRAIKEYEELLNSIYNRQKSIRYNRNIEDV